MLQDAARFLQKEADKWEDENNPIVQVAKEMSLQMEQMAEFCKGDGPVGVRVWCTSTTFSINITYVIHDIMYMYMAWYRSNISFIFSEITIHTSIWSIIGIIDYFPQNHQDVVRVALAIADNGRKMKQFTDVLAKHCVDQR